MPPAQTEVTDALSHLMDVQDQQGDILARLEQRAEPDLVGLCRHLDDLADVLERFQEPPPLPVPPSYWRLGGVAVIGVLVGVLVCWMTLQYWPTEWLPPGLYKPAPAAVKKGRF